MYAARLNGIRAREEHEAKLASDEAAGIGLLGGFDVTVEGVAISGPLETPGEIRVATEHDWRSADIGGEGMKIMPSRCTRGSPAIPGEAHVVTGCDVCMHARGDVLPWKNCDVIG